MSPIWNLNAVYFNSFTNSDNNEQEPPVTGVTGVNFASTDNGATLGNTTINGSNVSSNYFGPDAYSLSMDSTQSWHAVGAIFNDSSNVNSIARSNKSANNSASTFSASSTNTASSPAHIVVDLGQERTFNQARYYQTFSDGKTTHAALDYSTTGNLETYSSSNWQEIHGFVLLDNSSTSDGVSDNFSDITARYLRIRIYNDGRYGDSNWTELYNIKLFYV